MTMEIISEHGDHCFTLVAWKQLIDLALQYGWKPAGAHDPDPLDDPEDEPADDRAAEIHLPPPTAPDPAADEAMLRALASLIPQFDDPLLYSYFENAGFRVTAEDARNLADALERALPDVPDHEALAQKVVELPSAPGQRFLPLGTPVNPYEWFSGRNKRHLVAFIALCRQGGFEIW